MHLNARFDLASILAMPDILDEIAHKILAIYGSVLISCKAELRPDSN